MKSNGWHFMHGGREIWRATKAEIARLAASIADKTGRPVTVRPGRRKKPTPTAAPSKGSTRRKVMKPNPDPLAYLGMWREQEKGRQARLDYLAATKARRVAKSLPPRRRDQAAAAVSRGGQKTVKFRVDVKRGGEEFSMGRPSRSAAETLAQQFLAAGYKVKVSEA